MRTLFGLTLRWGARGLTGLLCGIFLESVHNLILLSPGLDSAPLSACSRIVIHTFRSCGKTRLPAGWGSSLSSLFTVMNLLFFIAGCLIVLKAGNRFSVRRKLSPLLDWCLVGNILLFFFLFDCLAIPLIQAKGIMGAAETDLIGGATTIGNLLCSVESAFPAVFLAVTVMSLLGLRLKGNRGRATRDNSDKGLRDKQQDEHRRGIK
jgi:hypothetical protein